MRRNWLACAFVLGLFIGGVLIGMAQSAWQPGHGGIGFSQEPETQWVRMVSSPDITVRHEKQPGHPQAVKLQFAIQTGLHINSHTPRSRYLIPTTLTLDGPQGVKIARIEYPPGVDYHFDFSPNDAVSVYTGTFDVSALLVARPGRYTVHGRLHYQACDNRTCNPPRTLPVTLNLAAK